MQFLVGVAAVLAAAVVGSQAQCLTSDDTQMNVTNAQAIYISGSHDFGIRLFQKLYSTAMAEVSFDKNWGAYEKQRDNLFRLPILLSN